MVTLYFLLYCAKIVFPLLKGCVLFWNDAGEELEREKVTGPCIKTKTSRSACIKLLL